MGLLRTTKKYVARVTGVQRVLDRRIEQERVKHDADVVKLTAERDYAARQARVQRRRAQGAEKMYRTNRRRANELAALVRTLDQIPRYDYGSLMPGNQNWAKKWKVTTGHRIALFAKVDYSGSFYKWAAAINEHTPHAARLAVTAPHQFGYSLDLLIPNPNLIKTNWRDLWEEADILHIKDETGFMDGSNRLPREMLDDFRGPVVFTQYGGYARKNGENPAYQEFVRRFDSVISMTPDLCFDWLGASPNYVPHSIDTRLHEYSWLDGPLIGHSPSTRGRKGTEEFLQAIDDIKNEYGVDVDLIEGVSHEESVARKRHLGLFFDQAGREMANILGTDAVIGWYGNSALEAAVYGVPTVAHLSKSALDGARRAGFSDIDNIPIVNTQLGYEGIRETFMRLLEMTGAERESLARSTRLFIEEFHSQSTVGTRLIDVYRHLV